jgi:uncharacterized protein (DUF2267 family)
MLPRLPIAVLIAAVLAFAGDAAGQGSVTPIPNDVQAATQALNDAQKKSVADYVDAQARAFAGADPAQAVEIRNAMCKLLKGTPMRDPCRREVGGQVVRAFRPFAKGTDPLRATNTFIIARHAPCTETAGFLLDNSDATIQSDVLLRVAASAQLPQALRDGQFAGPQAESNAKQIAAAMRAEKDWVVASHLAEALVEALRSKGLTAASADLIATTLSDSINDLAKRTLDGDQPDLVFALQRALLAVRNRTSEIAPSARAKLLNGTIGSINRLVAMKGKAPAAFVNNERTGAFDSVTNTSEVLLQVQQTLRK